MSAARKLIAVAIAALVFGHPQAAANQGGTSSLEAADGTIGATVSSGSGAGSGSGGGGRPRCDYDAAPGGPDEVTRNIGGTWYVAYLRTCNGAVGVVWIPELDGEDLADLAVDEIRRQLPAPVTNLAPEADRLVAQLSTWIWTDASTWQPVSVTASIPTLSATVTARPLRLRFDPGDGALGTGSLACAGPGQPWLPAYGDERPSACSYTYRHASSLAAAGSWTTTTSIDWAVSYQVSDGTAGNLAQLTTRSNVPVTVNELQALVTGSG